jgi:hypothetical protein
MLVYAVLCIGFLRTLEFLFKKDSTFYKIGDTPCMIPHRTVNYISCDQISDDLALEFGMEQGNQVVNVTTVMWKGKACQRGVRAGEKLLSVNGEALHKTPAHPEPVKAIGYVLRKQGWLRGQPITLYFENPHLFRCFKTGRGRKALWDVEHRLVPRFPSMLPRKKPSKRLMKVQTMSKLEPLNLADLNLPNPGTGRAVLTTTENV